MLWSHIYKIGQFNFSIKIITWRKGSVRTQGYSARVIPTCLFVILLDYDNIVDERLIPELRDIQEWFEVGNFYVLSSSELGRHCICLDALPLHEVITIVNFSSCDRAFKKAPRISEYRTWVLRYQKKGNRPAPHYVYTIESIYEGQNPQSVGHKLFLEQVFGIPVSALKNPIGEKAIEIQTYNTWSKVSQAELEKIINQERRR